MKKILLIVIVTIFITMVSVPVMAATEWTFGASLRYATFWTQEDAGKGKINDFDNGGRALNHDGRLEWETQGNSRILMWMKSDNLEGYIEMGYNVAANRVTTREYWGKYRFNERFAITIGQQDQLFSAFISNQVWCTDMDMLGYGTSYEFASPKITLTYGNFNLAFSKPNSRADDNTIIQGTKDVDTYLPQLQANYQHFAEAWRLRIAGAYQFVSVNKFTPSSPVWLGGSKDHTIHSWLVSVDGDVHFGPLTLSGYTGIIQNGSDARWNDEGSCLPGIYTNQKNFKHAFGANYRLNDNSIKWESTTTVMVSLVAAYRLTESLRLELGGGWRYDDNKLFAKNSNIWNVYLQAAYTVTPGFTITPEIGYMDFGKTVGAKYANSNLNDGAKGKGTDAGNLWYVGAKWQMDF